MKECHYLSPYGIIKIFTHNNALKAINLYDLSQASEDHSNNDLTLLEREVTGQLNAYFEGKLQQFDLPILMEGTDFQKKTWDVLRTIGYGETRSYAEVARSLGNIHYTRAVGGACNKNPLPIIIPCHRVVGSQGKLTGFAGGLRWKQALLELEA